MSCARSARLRTTFVCVKLEAGPVEMSRWIERLDGEFAIWGGDGGVYLLDCLRSGAAGIIPGVDLIDLLVRVYEAEERGDTSLAEERLREILPMLVYEMQHSIDHYNACAKRVLVHRGILEHAGLRPPGALLERGFPCIARSALFDTAARHGHRPCSVSELERKEGLREPERLSHQLSTLLAAEIVSGRIDVGAAFPSSEEIVNRYGVSRTVAREMVQALAMLGMVNIQHGKRTEVCPPEDWDILSSVVQEALRREGKAEPLLHDLYEFRILVEPQAAAWMAEYASPAEVNELVELADQDGGASRRRHVRRDDDGGRPEIPRSRRECEREPGARRGEPRHP